MADKVKKVGIEKEKGYLYYLDKNGDIARSKMARGSDKGFLYYIDKDGDISKSPMARR